MALAMLAGSALPVALTWRHHGPRHACRMGSLLMAGIGWRHADAYLYLDLSRWLDDGVLLADLGSALWLTSPRSVAAYSPLTVCRWR